MISDDFHEAAQGRWFAVLNEDGSRSHWCLKMWLVVFCGDYPQSQSMGPWMEAVGAYVPCRGCDYRVDNTMQHETPHSFFDANAKWRLRDARNVMASITKWRACPCKEKMQALGVNKLYWALSSVHFPEIDFCTLAVQDIMHLFADGISRHEAAWMLYLLHSRGFLTLARVNELIRQYQKWPRDCRVPQLPSSVKDGAAGGFPRQDATIHMSASQTFTFCLHRCAMARVRFEPSVRLTLPFCVCSVALLSPELSEAAKGQPFWKSWVAHVRLLEMSLRDEYDLTDVLELDELVKAHHRAFLAVRLCSVLCYTPYYTPCYTTCYTQLMAVSKVWAHKCKHADARASMILS